ncbi:MAG: leucine-rich repeat domain-containing protein [Eubacteriales bacterium]|nr:leucine-rich repeat domain-containing protein [Eubacteriales bacterium]
MKDFDIDRDRLLAYTGRESHPVLPPGIRSVAAEAFSRNPVLRTVVFPDSVEHVGERAFFACPSLREILPGSRLRSLGAFAFADCTSLRMPAFPSSLREIGDYAFSRAFGSGGRSDAGDGVAVLPDGVTHLGAGAFWGCRGIVLSQTLRDPSLGRALYDPDKRSGHWAESLRFKGHFLSLRGVPPEKTLYKLWMASRTEGRNCLDALMELWQPGGSPDLAAYDGLFSSMISEDDKTKISVYRLLYPRDLAEAAKSRYLSWLEKHAVRSVEIIEKEERWALLKLLSFHKLLYSSREQALFDAVNRTKDTRCVAWLLRRRRAADEPDDLTL